MDFVTNFDALSVVKTFFSSLRNFFVDVVDADDSVTKISSASIVFLVTDGLKYKSVHIY